MGTAVPLDISEYLKSHKRFKQLSDALIQQLTDAGRVLSYKEGEHLFAQDQQADHFYIVLNGDVSVEIPAIYGPPLVVQSLQDGNILGWSWLIPPYLWTFEAIAEKETEVIEFDGVKLRKACEQNHELGYELMKVFSGLMSERLHEARRKMMETWSAPGFA